MNPNPAPFQTVPGQWCSRRKVLVSSWLHGIWAFLALYMETTHSPTSTCLTRARAPEGQSVFWLVPVRVDVALYFRMLAPIIFLICAMGFSLSFS